jgi:hypothetical protein
MDHIKHSQKLREKLQDLDRSLRRFDDFYAFYNHSYLTAAKRLAYHAVGQMRPPDADEKEWRKYRNDIANSIASSFSASSYVLYINISGKPSDDKSEKLTVTRSDLQAWVNAGIAREEGAKRITTDDELLLSRPDGMKQLVWRLALAYYGSRGEPNYERLRDAIQSWVKDKKGKTESTSESFKKNGKIPPEISTAIKKSWANYFRVIMPIDYKEWAKSIIAKQ